MTSIKNIVINFDQPFVDENFRLFLTETYGHDEIYIISDKDRAFLLGRSPKMWRI